MEAQGEDLEPMYQRFAIHEAEGRLDGDLMCSFGNLCLSDAFSEKAVEDYRAFCKLREDVVACIHCMDKFCAPWGRDQESSFEPYTWRSGCELCYFGPGQKEAREWNYAMHVIEDPSGEAHVRVGKY